MDATEFVEHLKRMSGEDLALLDKTIGAHLGTAAGEIEWWEATILVERLLRAQGRSREAASAAHQAVLAVRVAGDRDADCGVDRVTRVARSAAEIARALVAGPLASDALAAMLTAWSPVLHGLAAA